MPAKRKRPKQSGKKNAKAPPGRWVTTHPNGKPLYKVMSTSGHANNGGSFSFGKDPVGKVFSLRDGVELEMCRQGFHLTSVPTNWSGLKIGTRTFLAAYWLPNGQKIQDSVEGYGVIPPRDATTAPALKDSMGSDKIVCRKIKILKELLPKVVKEPVLPTVKIVKVKGKPPKVVVTRPKPGKLSWTAKKGPDKKAIEAKLAKEIEKAKRLEKSLDAWAKLYGAKARKLEREADAMEGMSIELCGAAVALITDPADSRLWK